MNYRRSIRRYMAAALAALLALSSVSCADKPKTPEQPANVQSGEENAVPVPQVSQETERTEGAAAEATTDEATTEEPATEELPTEEPTTEEPTTEGPATEAPTPEASQPLTGGQYIYDPMIRFMIAEGSSQMMTEEKQDPSYPYTTAVVMPLSAEYRAYEEQFVAKNLEPAMAATFMNDLETNGVRYITWVHDAWPLSAGPGTGAKEAAEKIISNFTSRGVPVSDDLTGNSVKLTVETGADGTPLYAAWQHNYQEGIMDRTYVLVFVDLPNGKLLNISFEYMDEGMRKAWEVFRSTFELVH